MLWLLRLWDELFEELREKVVAEEDAEEDAEESESERRNLEVMLVGQGAADNYPCSSDTNTLSNTPTTLGCVFADDPQQAGRLAREPEDAASAVQRAAEGKRRLVPPH